MFKSITFLHYNDNEDDCTDCIYKIIDTDFECKVDIAYPKTASEFCVSVAMIIISEYKERNYSHDEIVKSLFRCNLFVSNKYKYSFEDILKWQQIGFSYKKYLNKGIIFNEKHYRDLKDMWDKHKVFV